MRRLALPAALATALVLAGAALAAERSTVRLNASDQAAARAAVLRKADLGAGWSGGASKPDLSADDRRPEAAPARAG